MSYVYDKYCTWIEVEDLSFIVYLVRHIFHYLVDNGITFLCMADEDVKRRITFAFLEDIKKQWRARYASVEGSAMAFSLQESFSPILKQQIVCFSFANDPL